MKKIWIIALVTTCVLLLLLLRTLFKPSAEHNALEASTFQQFGICASYWEQQTNAIINMWSFQKWAHVSKIFHVVEPFANSSMLSFTDTMLRDKNFKNALRFRDYFDLEYWTMKTAQLGIPALVPWELFTELAIRKAIVVILAYEVRPGGVYVDDDIKQHSECISEFNLFYKKHSILLNSLNFEIIRNVCFAFYNAEYYLKLEEFNSYLLLDTGATVWFSYWRGVQFDRITIKDKFIERAVGGEKVVFNMIRASPRVIKDARRYVNKVLGVDFYGYTAVAFRTRSRKNAMSNKGYSRNEILGYYFTCADKLPSKIRELDSKANFLSSDLGQFGDWTGGQFFDYDHKTSTYDYKGTRLLQSIINATYGYKTITKYGDEFVQATGGISDTGYIGAVQKTIVEYSKCILLMGGHSSFQRSMLLNYERHRTNTYTSPCIDYLCFEDPL